MTNQLHISIEPSLQARMRVAGERYHMDEQTLLCHALEEFLVRDERRRHELEEDERRWEEYKATGVSIPHEDVLAWMDDKIAELKIRLNLDEK